MIDQKSKPDQLQGSLVIVGANHRSSNMLLRDRLYISEAALPAFYQRLQDLGFIEAVIFSTKDLTEIIIAAPNMTVKTATAEIIKLLAAHAGESRGEIEDQIYSLSDHEATRHLFSVAAALDSLVIGDRRIKEQFIKAHRLAKTNGMTGHYLDQLFSHAQIAAERVLLETEIDQRPVSIAAAAVQVARDLHGDLEPRSALLIGAGEMGEMLASSLRAGGLTNLIVTHPSPQRADTLGAQLNCHIGVMDNLDQLLIQADIIVTSMNTRHYILNTNILKTAIKARRRKPIFIIDSAVPGDVDPAVEAIEDIFLYTLDDLERVTREGRASRAAEADKASEIINQEAAKVVFGTTLDNQPEFAEDIEDLRRVALDEANGDAEKATRLLLDRLKSLKKKNRDI